MTLVLSRTDYVSVGVTSRGTTRLFPPPDFKQPQKFAVADHDGILQIFGIKKGEFQVLFKSLPGPKITNLVIGGTLGTPKDKIFLSHGNTVSGYTKKGKLFLEFDTSLIDPISAMYVLGPDLAACARDLYHRYRECKDEDSFLVGEKLLDVVLLPTSGSTVTTVLACGDCAIRVLCGTKSPTILRLPSVPCVLAVYREGEYESKDRVLMGTIDGKVGLLILSSNKSLRVTWLLNTPGAEVTCVDTYELQEGIDLIVGRQDGYIEVHTMPADEDATPMLRCRYNAKESITAVAGGIIGTPGYPEILVTTYSGRIFGLTTKPPGLLEAAQTDGGLAKLKAEITHLEECLLKSNELSSILSPDNLSPVILSINHRIMLNEDDASYSLSIELDTTINNILIQSDTPIELLDVESNNAVLTLSPCNPIEGNFVLATYRCHDNTSRLEIRLRSIEGQPGMLQVYVTSQIEPKCCRKVLIPICALSHHIRVHADENKPILGGPFNELRLTGGFSMAEMHAWLSFALLDVPERPLVPEGESEATLIYKSCFIGTLLKCKYKKGSATFHSENISTIIILRDILTKQATKRKTKLEVYCDVCEASISRVLELILPQLHEAHELMEKIQILDALQEWELKSDPSENLCSEYHELLNNEQHIRNRSIKDSELLLRLHAIVTDLYVDWERAKGSRRISTKQAAEKLNPGLESMDLTLLLQVFIGKDNANDILLAEL